MAWQPTAEQRANASTIVEVGARLGASMRDLKIALMTALQESNLRNINYGDRDSLGLFQQRPSQGWGSQAEVRDPVYAATKFFQGKRAAAGADPNPGLFDLKNRDKLTLTQAAQAVQRSAYPDAYAKWEDEATSLLASVRVSPIRDGKVTTGYGETGPLWKSGKHTGVDFAAPVGTAVYAAAAGRVVAEGDSRGPFGTWVKVASDDGSEQIYGHLSSERVRKGQTVAPGQQIGAVGATGNVTGPHLHYEERKAGAAVDPLRAGFLPVGLGDVGDALGDAAGAVKDKAGDILGGVTDLPGQAASKLAGALGEGLLGVFTSEPVRDAGTRILAVVTGIGLVWLGIYRISAPAREKAVKAVGTGAQLAATRGAGAGAAAGGAGKAGAAKPTPKPAPKPAPETPPF